MDRIKYKTPISRIHFVIPAALLLLGFGTAAYLLPDRFNIDAWSPAFHRCTSYVFDFVAQALRLRQPALLLQINPPALLFFSGTAITPFLAGLYLVLVFSLKKTETKNVSQFANKAEIRRMGFGDLGPVLGIANGNLLRAATPVHVLAVAPTRTGKTRQAITTVLDYPGSVVVIDPKREIRQITEPHRATLGDCFTISFGDPRSRHGWNPFAISNLPTDPVSVELYIKRLAGLLAPDNPRANDKHWDDTALRNLTALGMLEAFTAIKNGQDGHIGHLIDFINQLPSVGKDEDPFTVQMYKLAGDAIAVGAPDWVADDLRSFANIAGNERSSHLSSLLTKLQVYRGEATRKSLGTNDVSVSDLRSRPTTIFIDFPREDARSFGPITALFLEALFSHALTHGRKEDEYPILVIMDEFRDLPIVPNLISVMTQGAGAGISAYILVQGLSQVKERYPDSWQNIENNSEYIMVFENPDPDTQRMLTEKVGKTFVIKKSENLSRTGLVQGGNRQKTEQDLISRQDWGVIPFGRHILLARRHQIRPVWCTSAFWDQIPSIRRRVPRKNRIKT